MNSCELVTFVSTLSCAIANKYSAEEAALIAAIFTQLGDSIATILTARECEEILNDK